MDLFEENIVMMMPVLALIEALDDSVDMSYGDWQDLFSRKLMDCSERFIESVIEQGVQAPICIRVNGNEWEQGNGHHRLAVMFRHDPFGEIPVVFSEEFDYMKCEITEGDYTLPSCW